MLASEPAGKRHCKASVLRALGERLPLRGRGSLECRFENISSVLAKAGRSAVKGYRPKDNAGGGRMTEAAVAEIEASPALLEEALGFAVRCE